MYGLPKNIDLNFLKGREVVQVAIGVFQIQFGFDEDAIIYAHSQFTLFDGHKDWTWTPEPSKVRVATRALRLLGAIVENVQAHEDGTLILSFSNGNILTLIDNSMEYESYDITRRGEAIIV
jgi:hypothetical protein